MSLAARRRQRAATSGTAHSDYDALVLSHQPAAYWNLAAGSRGLSDLTGNGHKATAINSPETTTFPDGQSARRFDGGSQYIEIADDSRLSVTDSGILTIEAWLRPDALEFSSQEGSGYIHWMGKGSDGQHEYAMRMYSLTNSEGRPSRISGYSFNTSGGLGAGSYFQDDVAVGEWIHYVFVINTADTDTNYPTGYTKIFKNGVLRDKDSLSDFSVVPGDGTAPLRIGTRDMASFFQGAIGKVAVYQRELTELEIMEHHRKIVPLQTGSAKLVKNIGSISSNTTGTSMVIPVTQPVAAGNTLLVRVLTGYTASAATVIDSKGNVYTRDRTAPNSLNTMRLAVFSAPISTGLAAGDSITITTPSVSARGAVADEFSGIIQISPLDQQNATSGTSVTPGLNINITPTQDDCLLLGIVGVAGPESDSYVEPALDGWVGIGRTSVSGGVDLTLNTAYRSVNQADIYRYTPTLGVSRDWVEFIISYKAATTTSTTAKVSDDFAYAPNHMITDASSYSFASFPSGGSSGPGNPSSKWEMDTGQLIESNGWGYTGTPVSVGSRYFFRLNTRDFTVKNQTVEWTYKSATFGQNGYQVEGPDGTCVWLRYVTQYHLYEIYIDRTDGKFVAKRKVPADNWSGPAGQVSNKGVYYNLRTDSQQPVYGAGQTYITWSSIQSVLPGAEMSKPGAPNLAHDATAAGGTEYHFRATARTLSGGEVQLQLFREGALVGSWTDNNNCTRADGISTPASDVANGYYGSVTGWEAWWGQPIDVPGATGFRADNIECWFDDFSLTDR